MGNLTRWRSSTLNLLDEACPRALDHSEASVAYDRRIFGAGVCAHAMLEGVGNALVQLGTRPNDMEGFVTEILSVVSSQLMSEGRRFDGGPVEVMTPADVAQGRKLAEDYLATHELSRGASYELGLAVDRNMRAVPYDSPDARLVGVLDVVGDEDQSDEDGAGGIVRVGTDYKTAWPAGAAWLDSLQAKCQTVLLWGSVLNETRCLMEGQIATGVPDGVQVCLVNLRTHGRYSSDVLWICDNASQDVIDSYWRDIENVMRAADHRPRHAQPGPKCMGCRYAHACDDCHMLSLAGAEDGAIDDAVMLASEYAASLARTNGLRPLVVAACERRAIQVPGGEVGYIPASTMVANDDAPQAISRAWFYGETVCSEDSVIGMLKALKLGSGNVTAIARHLWPGRGPGRMEDFKERRAEFLARALKEKPRVEFGVRLFDKGGKR